MNPSEDPADRLLDSLLREQHRNAADESLLRDIETALTTAAPAVAAAPAAPAAPAAKRKALWLPPLAAAAVLVLSIGTVAYWQAGQTLPPQLSYSVSNSQSVRIEAAPARESNNSDGLPLKSPLSQNASLWDNSPFTTPPQSPSSSETSTEAAPALASNDRQAPSPPTSPPPPQTDTSLDAALAVNGKSGPREMGASPGVRHSPQAPAASMPALAKEEYNGPRSEYNKSPGEADWAARTPTPTLEAKPSATTKANRSVDGVAKDKACGLGTGGAVMGGGFSRDQYGRLTDQPWKSPWNDAMSTFSIDVDGASYTNVRNLLAEGRPVPPDAVRIEECINYFDYRYAGPTGEGPFAVHGTLATCPWQPGHLLARVAIKGREIASKARPASNLVFLIDVSGSMQDPKKLPLLKRSLRVLLDQLDERDRLGIVVYAGSEGVVLPPTTLDERGLSQATAALEKLEAGGSTNGGAGLQRAYAMASQHIVDGGVNRVILATDGDFNVGTTGQGELVALVKAEAAKGVSLSVVGFGTGNLNDAMLEAITNEGNGNYYYIDGEAEARRVFLQKLTGTLVTIAKDVKIQVEFNPGKVKAYRLIGYANRILRNEDFSNDKVDAGDIGAGHTVTAFYEIVPQGMDAPETGSVDGLRYQRPAGREVVPSDDWFTLKLRHKHPEGDVSSLIETSIKGEPQAWEQAGNDFRFASAVALFGMKLRQMPEMADVSWARIEEIAKPALADDPQEQRAGFIAMLRKLGR